MNSTTGQFKWVDRDTAARDLLQVAYHAPGYIGEQAWKLLSAIRSPALIPEMKAIALDAENPQHHRAFSIICHTPGNIYLPEFQPSDTFQTRIVSLIELLKYHPVNQDWILPLIDLAPQEEHYHLFWLALSYIPDAIAPRLIALYDQNPSLLDAYKACRLHLIKHPILEAWFQNHWEDIIYLCLIYSDRDNPYEVNLSQILYDWPELKEDLFRRCPAIKEEIEEKVAKRAKAIRDVRATSGWKKIEALYELALKGDEEAFELLHREAKRPNIIFRNDLGIIAAHFIGKLASHNERALELCLSHLKYDQNLWFYSEVPGASQMDLDTPVRREAAFAVSEIIRPVVWEAIVEAYFLIPPWFFEELLHNWIGRMTDHLSGVVSDIREWGLGDVNDRMWFRRMTMEEQDRSDPVTKSAAMYAEYYGVSKT